MKKDNLRDKLEGNELDLSLNNLSVVPVKELAAIPKATQLDLSCNLLTTLPDLFCTSLVHLVKIDLSKNKLTELPDNFGELENLQHLDLLGNNLSILPRSFWKCRKLKWLDLKDNPLNNELKKVAGDCLDEAECKRCATKILEHMRLINEAIEREKEKRIQEAKDLEAAQKAQEEKRKSKQEARKRKKNERKRVKELEQINRRKEEVSEEEEKEQNGNSLHVNEEKVPVKPSSGKCSSMWSVLKIMAFVLLTLITVTGVFNVYKDEIQASHYWKNYMVPTWEEYGSPYWQKYGSPCWQRYGDPYWKLYGNPALNYTSIAIKSAWVSLQQTIQDISSQISSYGDRQATDSSKRKAPTNPSSEGDLDPKLSKEDVSVDKESTLGKKSPDTSKTNNHKQATQGQRTTKTNNEKR